MGLQNLWGYIVARPTRNQAVFRRDGLASVGSWREQRGGGAEVDKPYVCIASENKVMRLDVAVWFVSNAAS